MTLLQALKHKINLFGNSRDEYLEGLIDSSKLHLKKHFGIEYNSEDTYHFFLVVDLAHYYYIHNGEDLPIPRSIVYRARNLCTERLTK